MKQLEHYIQGQWVRGAETGQILTDAVTGDPIASTSTKGIDFKSMIEYAAIRVIQRYVPSLFTSGDFASRPWHFICKRNCLLFMH